MENPLDILEIVRQRLFQTRQKVKSGLLREVRTDLTANYEQVYQAYKSESLAYDKLQGILKKNPNPGLATKAKFLAKKIISPLEEWMRKFAPGGEQYKFMLKKAWANSPPAEKEHEFRRYVGELTHAVEFASKIGYLQLAESAFDFRQSALEEKIEELSKRMNALEADIRGTPVPAVREELEEQLESLRQMQEAYQWGINRFKKQYAGLLRKTAEISNQSE